MKNTIRRAAALIICAACVFSLASCTDGNLDKDKDGIFGEEGKTGTDNIIGDGGIDDKANGGTAAAPDLGDMTNDNRSDNNSNNNGGSENNGGDNGNGGVLDPDDDVNGGLANGGNSVDPNLGIGTDGTQPSANGSN